MQPLSQRKDECWCLAFGMGIRTTNLAGILWIVTVLVALSAVTSWKSLSLSASLPS